MIVDPDQGRRARLKQAMTALVQFKNVRQANTLGRAIVEIDRRDPCDLIFVADDLPAPELSKFAKDVRTLDQARDAAIVLVLSGMDQNMATVSSKMSDGIDGFLFEPFSVDALSDTASIAARVVGERLLNRQKAVSKYLVEKSLMIVDRVAYQQVLRQEFVLERKMLKDIKGTLDKFIPEALEYYLDVAVEAFLAADPPSEEYEGKSRATKMLLKKKAAAKLAVELKEREAQAQAEEAKRKSEVRRILKK